MMKGALMAKEQGRRKILFLCTGNSARSIFAEYFMNRTGKNRFEAYSAGSQPAGTVNPFALRILRHMYNIDPSQARSKSWDEFKDVPFDFVITVCDSARESCPIFPGQPIVAHWGIPDPALATGNDEEKLRRFRDAALQIQRRIDLFCALPIEKLDRLKLVKLVQEIGDHESRKENENHGRTS
jgi:arsenate reductase